VNITRRDFLRVAGAGLTGAAVAARVGGVRPVQAQSIRPNIVVILTDDQDVGTLEATMPGEGAQVPVMRHLLAGRGGGWVRFDNAVCNQAICAPSRATLLTGQCAHRHGVVKNGWVDRMDNDHTLARWLHDAGYFTAFRGKYSFGKKDAKLPRPLGWDVWEPGGGYSSAVFPRGVQLLRQIAAETPIFLCLWPVDPHAKARPQPAYMARPVTLPPDNPSVNEADVSDKPLRIRQKKLLREGKLSGLREERRQACRALAGVDDGIKLILDALEETGRLANTIIVFGGDHGYLWGEHRLERKDSPYRPASGFPLLIRDFTMTGNRRETRLVSNIDIAPTLAEYAGVTPDIAVDGRSLVPLIRDEAAGWEERVLIEKNTGTALDPGTYRGLYAVLDGVEYCYIAHNHGAEFELYDLAADPDQMVSLHEVDEYAAVRLALTQQLAALSGDAALVNHEEDMMTAAASEMERRRKYRTWVERFWRAHATLAQIVIEDFPGLNEPQLAQYHEDAMRDLALREEALVEGYERRT